MPRANDKPMKHCPFCGSIEVTVIQPCFTPDFMVRCGCCGALGPQKTTRENSRIAWGRRTDAASE